MTSNQSDSVVDRDQSGDYRKKGNAASEPNILHFKHVYILLATWIQKSLILLI